MLCSSIFECSIFHYFIIDFAILDFYIVFPNEKTLFGKINKYRGPQKQVIKSMIVEKQIKNMPIRYGMPTRERQKEIMMWCPIS